MVRLDQLATLEGSEVKLSAWAFNVRSSGKIVFLQLRDGYGWAQAIVAKDDVSEAVWKTALEVTIESSVAITAIVSKHPKLEAYEMHVKNIELIGTSDEYPIGKKEHGVDFLIENRHLWLRSQRQWAIQRVRNTLILGIYEFFNQEGFIKIDSPILTSNACEGTTELFELDYFDEKAYLSQSGQLYIEAAIYAHRRVFDFGPVFRAEKSKTRRHLTEFWMMDAEMAFEGHEDNMAIQEKMIVHLVQKVLKENIKELEILERDIDALKKIKGPFPHMTHAEAVAKLRELGSDIKEDEDLGGDDETLLTKEFVTPIFIEKYPAEVKSFYMKRDPENESLALCDDMLAPEGYGEIIGGSEREDDYETMLKRVKEKGYDLKDLQWYVDLRKYGSVPHSGFGLGLERMVSWVCGLQHVRETIPFPRTINRLRP